MVDWGKWGKKSLRFICNSIEDDAWINILEGSVRSSKTVTMIPKWIEYIKRGPKGLLLMTGITKETVYDNVLSDLFDTLGKNSYTYNRNSGQLIVFWKEYVPAGCGYTEIKKSRRIKVLGAMNEGSEKYIRGKTLAGAYCDELSLMPESFFKQLLNRLSVEGAKLYGTTNPDSPFHYLYREYIADQKKIDEGLVRVWHFNLEDNPNLNESFITSVKNAYTGMWYDRMILGLWVLGSGRVYDMYSDDLLFDDKEEGPNRSNSSRYIAVDYGTINPMVFLDIYDDGEICWVMNEYYYDCNAKENKGKQKEDSQYADDLFKFANGEYPTIIIDPSAASFKATLRGRGYRVKDADNSVNDGIRMVGSMLHRHLIRINKKCTNIRNEFAAYVWDEKATLRGVEQVVKQNDHAMDALRYFVKTMIHRRRFAV